MTLFLAIAGFLVSLLLLEKGADLFTDSLAELGERTGVSPTVLGLLTAGMEWEELLVSVVAAFSGSVGIAVGNVIGASVANILGTFSLGPILRPVEVSREDRRFALFLGLATTAVTGLLWFRPTVGRVAGAALTGSFFLYVMLLLYLLRRGYGTPDMKVEEEDGSGAERGTLSLWLRTFSGLALILLGAEVLVSSTVALAGILGISEFVAGLTLVAVGTTLPDKIITIAGSLKDQSGVVTANLIGSNLFNLLFVLGVAALVHPLYVDSPTLRFDLPVLLMSTWLVVVLMRKGTVRRPAGVLLLVAYLGYLVFNFVGK